MKLTLLVAGLGAISACDRGTTPAAQDKPSATRSTLTDSGSADPWARPKAKLAPLEHPLFWSIEKDGKTSYALGTMHMGVDPTTRIPPILWQRFDEAKTFAMETDLSASRNLD